MNEIGGYFELEEFHGKEYYDGLIALNNARSALHYIIEARNYKRIYIPYYLCGSIAKKLEKINVEYSFYHVNSNMIPELNKEIDDDEVVYIVNYYGQIDNNKIKNLKDKYKNLIVDDVQAFFQRPLPGTDTFYSCRKFFGVPDGAYLSIDKKIDRELSEDKSIMRMSHLLGRYENSASAFYEDFRINDCSFDNDSIMMMSALSHNLLRGIDYEYVEIRRKENFECLHSALHKLNKLDIENGLFAYPLMMDDAARIRKHLINKKIYVPVLWPDYDVGANDIEKSFINNILPLPIDQRYGREEMEYMIGEIQNCIN